VQDGVTLHGDPINKRPLGFQAMAWVTAFDDVRFEGGRVDEFALVNARVSYVFEFEGGKRGGSMFVEAFNLFNRVHRENPDSDEVGMLLSAGVQVRW
jgi:hypothetical protein